MELTRHYERVRCSVCGAIAEYAWMGVEPVCAEELRRLKDYLYRKGGDFPTRLRTKIETELEALTLAYCASHRSFLDESGQIVKVTYF